MDAECEQAVSADVDFVLQQPAATDASERVEQLADVLLSYAEGEEEDETAKVNSQGCAASHTRRLKAACVSHGIHRQETASDHTCSASAISIANEELQAAAAAGSQLPAQLLATFVDALLSQGDGCILRVLNKSAASRLLVQDKILQPHFFVLHSCAAAHLQITTLFRNAGHQPLQLGMPAMKA